MQQVHLEQNIDAPADAVWNTLGTQFADIDSWASFVKSSRALADDEIPASVTVAPGAPVPGRETTTLATLKEVLVAYSDNDRSLKFTAIGLPPIVKVMQNTQTVHETATGSKVTFDIEMEFLGPFSILGKVMSRRMAKTFPGVLIDLKNHVEDSQSNSPQ